MRTIAVYFRFDSIRLSYFPLRRRQHLYFSLNHNAFKSSKKDKDIKKSRKYDKNHEME